MLIKDLIRELEKLPEDATIGMIDIDETRLLEDVSIRTNKEFVCDSIGFEISIERIEKSRQSNKSKICDYYIV